MERRERQPVRCRGQSILEYLVIAAVVIGAILAIKGTLTENMNTLYTKAAEKTSAAATSLDELSFGTTGTTTGGGTTTPPN